MQASSEGEMRGVGRTRPAEKAKEKVTEEKVSMMAKEDDLAAKGHTAGDEDNERRRTREAGLSGA